mmetsp:Transcript_40218/g.89259  ORF Transcript_40218/g.89259 Transcript_40218/m.89259 type:complete len:121 (+) Transcript_40218:96-458(+)|eukprot:CAMPEP_0202900744 /NCGR_PEP_ID=MMETSP1392-20130828/12010_1 /ASSEMBLY_ACC=CAM_ASM_000868 /TAXON_ID=225041 /ORGANISM="Chlamydomonas chlamydogama, Strain SAG 11-48b" /LENGTH=120 /DNA_ID=CAMNT_0049587183 /DNA_START=95 /DNA_END=457 /DNA_ORIENTATION=+
MASEAVVLVAFYGDITDLDAAKAALIDLTEMTAREEPDTLYYSISYSADGKTAVVHMICKDVPSMALHMRNVRAKNTNLLDYCCLKSCSISCNPDQVTAVQEAVSADVDIFTKQHVIRPL